MVGRIEFIVEILAMELRICGQIHMKHVLRYGVGMGLEEDEVEMVLGMTMKEIAQEVANERADHEPPEEEE